MPRAPRVPPAIQELDTEEETQSRGSFTGGYPTPEQEEDSSDGEDLVEDLPEALEDLVGDLEDLIVDALERGVTEEKVTAAVRSAVNAVKGALLVESKKSL